MQKKRQLYKYRAIVFVFICAPVFFGCMLPETRFYEQAMKYGFKHEIIQGAEFQHVIYTKGKLQKQSTLHIYLDGDGSAWINHRWVAANPTPRNTLVLDLMKQDGQAALYLGRPCYHGLSSTLPCSNQLWTSHRYSAVVVNSLVAAIRKILKQNEIEEIVLIGFSGGGALAMLVAEYFQIVKGVVTVAGNLDVAAWTQHHGYLPLSGSLNPMERQPLQKNIFQLHLAGEKDSNIPVEQIRAFVEKQRSAKLMVFDDYHHHCCWKKVWPSILDSIQGYN